MKPARITTRSVLGFCCSAKVFRGTKTLYETRAYPFGHTANAYQNAQNWALSNGIALRTADQPTQPKPEKQTRMKKPEFKPGSMIALAYDLWSSDPNMGAQDMHKQLVQKFPSLSITSVHAMRTQLRRYIPNALREKAASAPATGVKRGPYKKVSKKAAKPSPKEKASNGHSEARVALGSVELSVADAFRNLIRRIGTDAARKHLEEIERL